MNRLLVILAALALLVVPLSAGASGEYSNGVTVETKPDPMTGTLMWRWGWSVTDDDGNTLWSWTSWQPCIEDEDEPGTIERAASLKGPAEFLPNGSRAWHRVRRGQLSQAERINGQLQWRVVPKNPPEQSRPGGGGTINLGIDEDDGTLPAWRPWI